MSDGAAAWQVGDRILVRYPEDLRGGSRFFPAVRFIEIAWLDAAAPGAFYGADAETGQVYWIDPVAFVSAGITIDRWQPTGTRRGAWPVVKGLTKEILAKARAMGMRL